MVKPILPLLDRDRIRAEQCEVVEAALARVKAPADRLRVAAEIANAAQAEFDKLRPRRDAYAISLWAHDGLRALNRVIGVNRTRWYEIRGDVNPADVRYYATAMSKLPQLAADTAAAEERARAARHYRDETIAELVRNGWARTQIAEIIGRNPSRISHIKKAAHVA